MASIKMIAVTEYTSYHKLDKTFLKEIEDSGLIKITTVGRKKYIPYSEIPSLEKATRLFIDLKINTDGISTIFHLLKQLRQKEEELTIIRNKLAFYQP